MTIGLDSGRTQLGGHRCQAGVYAVEFALTFLIFFLLLYAILTYGMIFIAQQSLNLAAQDGARKGLATPTSMLDRADAAESEARGKLLWLTALGGADAVRVGHCLDLPTTNPTCQPSGNGELKVVAEYDYQHSPLIPMLGPAGLMGAVLPATLRAEASVDLSISTGERLQ